jgi:hypothetical protein
MTDWICGEAPDFAAALRSSVKDSVAHVERGPPATDSIRHAAQRLMNRKKVAGIATTVG